MPLFKTFRKSIRKNKVTTNGNANGITPTNVNGDTENGPHEGACPTVNGNGVCSNGIVDTPTVDTETSCSNGDTAAKQVKQKESKLLVVVKDFKGSNKKEMTVHRGQVVQRQYSCGTWVNVQNVNGDSGYIPTEVCCPKEDMEDSTWCALNREDPPVNGAVYENIGPATKKPEGMISSEDNHRAPPNSYQTPSTTHLFTLPDCHQTPPTTHHAAAIPLDNHQTPPITHRTPPTKANPYNSLSSTSTSLSRNSSKSTHPDTPHSNGGGAPLQHVSVRKLSSGTPFGVIEYSDSPGGVPRYSIEHMLHPLHPLSITRSHVSSESTGSPTLLGRRSSLDSQPSTPAVQPLLAHNRSDSYLEAVVERKDGTLPPKVPSLGVRRPSRPNDLPMLPLYSNLAQQQKLDTIVGSNSAVNTAQHMLQSSQTSCLLDDVFLPSEQKPIGIYEVMKSYQKQSSEEVSVVKGEFVIAMQMGYGQWASVITASNAEGLIPRGYLCRYSPLARRSRGINVGTQTELIIMAPTVTNTRRTNDNSTTPVTVLNRDIVSIRDIGKTSTPKKRRGKEMAIQTNTNHHSSSTIYPADSMAWENEHIDSTDELWYENSMSIPQLPQNNSMFTNEAPSICTLPLMNGGANTIRGEAPLAFHSSRESLPQFPLRNVKAAETQNHHGKQTDTFSPLSIRRTLKEQSDWPLSPGILSNFSSSSPRSPQMVILKATKDFTPDIDGTDYLPLCKGDILHLIPGHNPYKGWLWVNHVRQRCYGYVPKSHVTNACSQELKHRNGVMMYDEV